MAASHRNIQNDKLTIFTTSRKVNSPEIKEYIINRWEEISIGLENSTVLFIGGVHGRPNGVLGGSANNLWGSLPKQVSFPFE